MKVGDDLYDAKIRVLGEQIKHPSRKKRRNCFPRLKAPRWMWQQSENS